VIGRGAPMVARKRRPLAARDTNQLPAELDTPQDPKAATGAEKAQQIIDNLDARGERRPAKPRSSGARDAEYKNLPPTYKLPSSLRIPQIPRTGASTWLLELLRRVLVVVA